MNGRGLGLAGTIVVHGVAVLLLAAGPGTRKPLPPTYTVRLVAAPAPDQETRKAPEAFDRPAEEHASRGGGAYHVDEPAVAGGAAVHR